MLGKICLGVVLAVGVTSGATAHDAHRSGSSPVRYRPVAATAERCAEPQFILGQPGVAGQPFAFSGDAECLPAGGEFSHAVIAWGDGTTSVGTIGTVNHGPAFSSVGVSGQHVYGGAGRFCITVDVTDDETGQTHDGAWHTCAVISSSGSVPVVPLPPAPPPPPLPPPAPTRHPAVPILSALSETTAAWREGNPFPHRNPQNKAAKLPLGTIFSFSLNVPARVTFTFGESFGGRGVGQTCAAPTNKNGTRHCTRSADAGALTFSARAGRNRLRFDGLISARKRLRPGRYTLLVTATSDAGQGAQPKTLSFTVSK